MGKERCSKNKIQAAGKSKRDTGALQCPMADSCCLLLHSNLGRQNTAPHDALKCSAQKKVSFDACQSKTAAACRQFPRHGWTAKCKMGAVVSAPWTQALQPLRCPASLRQVKAAQGRQFCVYAEAGLKRASSTNSNAPHKLAFTRAWVDFAARNLFWRRFVLFCFSVYFVSLDLEGWRSQISRQAQKCIPRVQGLLPGRRHTPEHCVQLPRADHPTRMLKSGLCTRISSSLSFSGEQAVSSDNNRSS